jgi:hypothetical protein
MSDTNDTKSITNDIQTGLTSLKSLEANVVRVAKLRSTLVAIALVVASVCVAAGFGYCAGKRHQADAATRAQLDTLKAKAHAVADSIPHAEHALAVAHVATAQADTVAAARTAEYHAARARVEITSDTSVTVDSGPPAAVLPPIVALIRSADNAIAADSIALRNTRVELVDMTADRDLWRTRAGLDEQQLELAKQLHPPRCGAKCGATLGAGAVTLAIALVHFLL